MKGIILKNEENKWVFEYTKENDESKVQLPLYIEDIEIDKLQTSEEIECDIITKKIVDSSECVCEKTGNFKCENLTDNGIKECKKIKYVTQQFAKIISEENENWDNLYSTFWLETKKPRETESEIVNGLLEFPIWLSENYELPKRKKVLG